jgi:flagellar motor protein MotB
MQSGEDAGQLPVWPVFADVMACLGGLIVLLFVWAVVSQIDLSQQLVAEQEKLRLAQVEHAREKDRLASLERALAIPLADGRITLDGASVGIQGSVLFALASAELSDTGLGLVRDVAEPLAVYVGQSNAALMISGFTDDQALHDGGRFVDNWELSAQRALTVTRALVDAGFPRDRLVAAGFGDQHPVADNVTASGRAKNRRVEMTPLPKPKPKPLAPEGER